MCKKADWDSMGNDMKNYKLPSAPVQWDHLENTIGSLMKKHIPMKTPRPQKHKPWITREIIILIQRSFKISWIIWEIHQITFRMPTKT